MKTMDMTLLEGVRVLNSLKSSEKREMFEKLTGDKDGFTLIKRSAENHGSIEDCLLLQPNHFSVFGRQ